MSGSPQMPDILVDGRAARQQHRPALWSGNAQLERMLSSLYALSVIIDPCNNGHAGNVFRSFCATESVILRIDPYSFRSREEGLDFRQKS